MLHLLIILAWLDPTLAENSTAAGDEQFCCPIKKHNGDMYDHVIMLSFQTAAAYRGCKEEDCVYQKRADGLRYCFKDKRLPAECLLEDHSSSAENEGVCYHTEVVTTSVNVSYLQPVQNKKYMETRWKMENITRDVVKSACCWGYRNETGTCQPHCSNSCPNGICTAPERCTCLPGFTGYECEVVGGSCDPVSGVCSCNPGYTGEKCQTQCDPGHFGAGCAQKCDCPLGRMCWHEDGDCGSPCPPHHFGASCMEECNCDRDGINVPDGLNSRQCSVETGTCICKPNRFGERCELDCPFGYINGTCHTEQWPYIEYRRRLGVVKKDLQNRQDGASRKEAFSVNMYQEDNQKSGNKPDIVNIMKRNLALNLGDVRPR